MSIKVPQTTLVFLRQPQYSLDNPGGAVQESVLTPVVLGSINGRYFYWYKYLFLVSGLSVCSCHPISPRINIKSSELVIRTLHLIALATNDKDHYYQPIQSGATTLATTRFFFFWESACIQLWYVYDPNNLSSQFSLL